MLTKEQAIALSETEFWKSMTEKEIAIFQTWEDKLCMPFDVYHYAMEATLKRGVYTHEFGLSRDDLKLELLGQKTAPSIDEIIDQLPKEKTVIIGI